MRGTEYRQQLSTEACTGAFWRDAFSEFIATFFLVSVQCCLVLTWPGHDGGKGIGGVVEVSLGMGFIVCTMAWTMGDFGGGHMNPAVTIAMVISVKITFLRGLIYMIFQCAGGIVGAYFIYGMTPDKFRDGLAVTSLGPEVEWWQGLLIEAWITCILVITILGSTNQKRKGNIYMATIPIGFAIALGLFLGFMYTGGSMNPARSLGPAVVMNKWDHHWVYWAGPIIGAVLAVLIYHVSMDMVDKKKSEGEFMQAPVQVLPYTQQVVATPQVMYAAQPGPPTILSASPYKTINTVQNTGYNTAAYPYGNVIYR